jgi:hypothetical protein
MVNCVCANSGCGWAFAYLQLNLLGRVAEIAKVSKCERCGYDTTIDSAHCCVGVGQEPFRLDLGSRNKMKVRLIELAAQMACRQSMPAPDDWPGWGPRSPQKLWKAANEASDKASNQCADWAYELAQIARSL